MAKKYISDSFVKSGGTATQFLKADGSVDSNSYALTGDANSRVFRSGDTMTGNLNMAAGSGVVLHPSLSGVNRVLSFFSASNIDNFASASYYPVSGTNVGATFSMIPRGTGFSAGIRSQLGVFNTDFVADPVNYESAIFRAAGTSFTLCTGKNGTGTIRPFLLSAGFLDSVTNPNQLWLYTSGRVGINNPADNGTDMLQVSGSILSTSYTLRSPLSEHSTNGIFLGTASGVTRTVLNARGQQTWIISNGTIETGSVGVGSPGGQAGILMTGPVGGGRSDIRMHNGFGGLALASGPTNAFPPTQVLLTSDGNFLVGTTTSDASAKVQIDTTTQGFLQPRMTQAQRLAIASPAIGLQVYQTNGEEGDYTYTSSGWRFIDNIHWSSGTGTYSVKQLNPAGQNIASGPYSHAIGYISTAVGLASHVEGRNSTSTGTASHAEGEHNESSGYASHAEGQDNIAQGYASHVEGYLNYAVGDYSHAEGFQTTANGILSSVGGYKTIAERFNEWARGGGGYGQYGMASWFGQTFHFDPTELYLDGSSALFTIPINDVYTYEINVAAIDVSTGDASFWLIQGAIKNIGGTTSLVGAGNTTTVITQDGGLGGASVVFNAEDTFDYLQPIVTGGFFQTINWHITMRYNRVNII